MTEAGTAMIQLLEKETSRSPVPHAQPSVSQAAGTSRSGETESGRMHVLIASNRDEVGALVAKLRPQELRSLAEDIMNAAILACNANHTDELRELVVSWLETADVLITTRRRLRHVLRARQDMRDRFGDRGL